MDPRTLSRPFTAVIRHTKMVYAGGKVRRFGRKRWVVVCQVPDCEFWKGCVSEEHAEADRSTHIKTAHFDRLLNGTAAIYDVTIGEPDE